MDSKPSTDGSPRWLSEPQTARRLNMSAKWLQKRRLAGLPPRYVKFGNAVRYSIRDIETFEALSLKTSTSESGTLCNQIQPD